LQNAAGCDSIVTLNLTINQSTASTQAVSACGSYVFNNQTLSQSGTYKDTLQNAAGCDSIVTLNLTINQSTASTQAVSACGSYVFNNQTLTQSGTYKDTLQNTAGCDSIVTLNLTINANPTPTVNASGYDLTTQSFAGYQWQLNGNNIAGATSQNYTATANGSYVVAVTDANGCQGTSTAVNIAGVGINATIADAQYNIYPNPVLHSLHIDVTNDSEVEATIVTLNGQKIANYRFLKSIEISTELWAQGVYLLRIQSNDGITQCINIFKQ
jgi:hypothetical protein